MKARKLASIAGLAVGLLMSAGAAQSALWSFEDDDIDFILRPIAPGGPVSTTPVTTGNLTAGDVFVSVFQLPVFTINGVNAIPAGMEMTGVAAIQLTSIVGGGGPGTLYNFAPYTGGLDAILQIGDPLHASCGTACAAGGGAMIAMYLNDTATFDLELNRSINPATNCTSLSNCIDEASKPTLFQVDGFAGDAEEFWQATQVLAGGGNIGTVAGTNNNFIVASFNAALSTFFNVQTPVQFQSIATGALCPGVTTYAADGCVQLVIAGTITGGAGLSNGAIAHSDLDAQKYVPEPGTLALIGAGLMALAGRRRKQGAAA